jgi:hypothetical protein
MSTPQQILANQANAQKSTGPRSAEGKAAAARNAFTHGLSASPETLFANAPAVADEFRAYAENLRKDYGPQVAALEPLFDRWVFAAFQLQRAQSYETRAEMDMANDFGNAELEKRWMRFTQTRLRLAREAAAALKDYHALRDYFARAEAVRDVSANQAKADAIFQQAHGTSPLLSSMDPKRVNSLLERFQTTLANMAQTNPTART